MENASAIARSTHADALREGGVLPPCRNLPPLDPPLELREYEMMEADTAKYLLYFDAINQAVSKLAAKTVKSHPMAGPPSTLSLDLYSLADVPIGNATPSGCNGEGGGVSPPSTAACVELTAVVVGPGRGRLPSYILDACDAIGVRCRVLCIEANPLALAFLEVRFADDPRVTLVHAVLSADAHAADLPAQCRSFLHECDLSVSELLGTFADNEFMPELLCTIERLFLHERSVRIPASWTVEVVPVSAPRVDTFIREGGRRLDATYVTGLDPSNVVFWGDPQPCWTSMSGDEPPDCGFTTELTFPLHRDSVLPLSSFSATDMVITGMAGYFQATLFENVRIDTRHNSPSFNSHHWEVFYFPFASPVVIATQLRSDSSSVQSDVGSAAMTKSHVRPRELRVQLARKTESVRDFAHPAVMRLWYEWRWWVSSASKNEDGEAAREVTIPSWSNFRGETDSITIQIRSEERNDEQASGRPTTKATSVVCS
jgi:hypothetical protein